QVGGVDLPITVVARDESSSAAMLIQSIVLGDRRITQTARLATTDDAVIDLVSQTPGAIGYVSINYMSSSVLVVPIEGLALSVTTIANYPIRGPIVFIGAKEPGNDAYRDFFVWVQSPAGQAIVGSTAADYLYNKPRFLKGGLSAIT